MLAMMFADARSRGAGSAGGRRASLSRRWGWARG